MEYKEFSEKLQFGLEKLNIQSNENQINQFFVYTELLDSWNKNINLTRIKKDDFISLHFLDSVSILSCIEVMNQAKIVDVGSGAGFPGIPLKILRNDLEVTLIDARNKKVSFLNELIKELKLENIEAIHTRAEDYYTSLPAGKYKIKKFDFAVARALTSLTAIVELLSKFVNEKGSIVAMKSDKIDQELKEAKYILKKKHYKIAFDNLVAIPDLSSDDKHMNKSVINRRVLVMNKS